MQGEARIVPQNSIDRMISLTNAGAAPQVQAWRRFPTNHLVESSTREAHRAVRSEARISLKDIIRNVKHIQHLIVLVLQRAEGHNALSDFLLNPLKSALTTFVLACLDRVVELTVSRRIMD